MKLVMLGPPGAGKGTQAKKLAEVIGVPHISTGDIFRRNIMEKTPLGKKASVFMDRGDLVPDEITVAMVEDRLGQADCGDGFILDGFPRTVPQAVELDKMLENMDTTLNGVVEIVVGDGEILHRLLNRRACPVCGRIYHLIFNPPCRENTCDDDGATLIHRSDDTREVIKNRIAVYKEKTGPLVDYYRNSGKLLQVNGEQPIEGVLREVGDRLKISSLSGK